MTHKLLECKEIFKKTSYLLHEPIASVFSVVKEILEFAYITGTSYTQHQSINVSYGIIHRTGKFSLAISEYNLMPDVQKTWFGFKQFSVLRTVNYNKHQISPFSMRPCTIRIWYVMWWQDSRRSCNKNQVRSELPFPYKNHKWLMWKQNFMTINSSYLIICSICRL